MLFVSADLFLPCYKPNIIYPKLAIKNLRKQKLAFIFASIYLHIMEARRDVFQAIADPTRRDIIGMLAAESLNVNAIAEKFDMTRQAISLHIKILEGCGLITINQRGRERFCEARLEQLDEVSSWVEQSRKQWNTRFDKLGNYLKEIQTNNNGKK